MVAGPPKSSELPSWLFVEAIRAGLSVVLLFKGHKLKPENGETTLSRHNLLFGALLAFSFLVSAAHAATQTTTFSVGATVTDSCSVSASALAFGNIDPLDNASNNTDATTTIDVTCANGTTYDVGLDAGTGTGATVSDRKMTSGGNTLNYALYSDGSRTTNWGATVGTDTVAGTGNGAAQTLTVYGRVPSGQQTAAVGSYTDTITVTVTY